MGNKYKVNALTGFRGALVASPSQNFLRRSVMNYQEGLTLFESILPIAVGISLGCLAFLGAWEFWHELAVACKGDFQ